ncbi:MAG: hypothetical protein AAFO94_15740, partial [Bacteroidota bacterium]
MKRLFFIVFALSVSLVACKKETTDPSCTTGPSAEARVFEFLHSTTNDTFLAWTSDTAVIQSVEAQLALPQEQRSQHINGTILRLPEGCNSNQQWSWYFAPDAWSVVDISIELCDGNPQYVEENIDEYVDKVGSYCPWGS